MSFLKFFAVLFIINPVLSFRFFNRGRSVHGNLGEPNGDEEQIGTKTTVNDLWFKQKLDHFNLSDDRIWYQRYYINDSFYGKPRNPVFLMIGGEGEASPSWIRYGAWIEYAKIFHAFCFMLEHRFYGKSHPTNDLSIGNLKYLSSEQAIEDLAAFIRSMNEKFHLYGSKWVVFGGSYPGTLAAWLRHKYPNLVHAAVSSSGPLLAKVNFKEYYKVVKDDLKQFDGKCVQNIDIGIRQLSEKLRSEDGRFEINKLFKLCDNIDDEIGDKNDMSNFFQTIASNLAGIVQYNKDNRISKHAKLRNLTIDTICASMLNKNYKSYKGLADINAKILDAYNQTCLDFKYEKMINLNKNTTWSSEVAEGSRQWTYQTCTEFGFFQTSDLVQNLFGNQFPIEFYIKQCSDIFGEKFTNEYIRNMVSKTNHKYGGKKINVTNVVFVHGTVDPWHVLGITKTVPGTKNGVILIKGAAHCANMYPAIETDSEELREARFKIEKWLHKWLSNDKSKRRRFYLKY